MEDNCIAPAVPADQMLKHRSCCIHLLALNHGQEPTKAQVEEITTKYNLLPCLRDTITCRDRTKRNKCAAAVTLRSEKMDSTTFEYLLENILRGIPMEKKRSVTHIDPIWFSTYLLAPPKPKVLSWIIRKDILSKKYKYVMVPIVHWNHWNLLILCHFGENFNSKDRKPTMFLLDSLKAADPMKTYAPTIRKFLLDLYTEAGVSKDKKAINKIPLLVPKVPQQTNDVECGAFVLFYISLFMKTAPIKDFSIISKHQPDFITEEWFNAKVLDQFSIKLERELSIRNRLKMMGFGSSPEQEETSDEEAVIELLGEPA